MPIHHSAATPTRPLTEVEKNYFQGGLIMLDEIGNFILTHPDLTREEILKVLAGLYIETLKKLIVK